MLKVAEELLPKSELPDIRSRLYEKTQGTRPDFGRFLDRRLWWTAAGVAAGLFALALGGAVVQQLMTAGLGAIDLMVALKGLRDSVVSVVTLSIVVSSAFKLFGLLADMQVTSDPLHDEQLEAEFRRIVDEGLRGKKSTRLVVFIDELDRCTPEQAVQVVDTLKSFLEVPRCLYVVAVDQVFLEAALAREVMKSVSAQDSQQAVQRHVREYINKVFLYQVPVPPLHLPRLQPFATTLIRDGSTCAAWSEAPADELAGVLIPTHTHSPRRVKALMNAFVSLHGIAGRRLTIAPEDRHDSCLRLAKLSTLRMEFPQFYSELVQYPLLGTYVCDLAEHGTCDMERASRTRGLGEIVARYADAERILEGSAMTAESPLQTEILLLRYLAKTRDVQMPSHEDIYLEPYENSHGLTRQDAEIAVDLARDYQQTQLQQLAQAYGPDPAVLGHVVASLDRLFGPELRNAVRAVLALLRWHAERADFSAETILPVATRLAEQMTRAYPQPDSVDCQSFPGAILALGYSGAFDRMTRLLDSPQLNEEANRGVLADSLEHASRFCEVSAEVSSSCLRRMMGMEVGGWSELATTSPEASHTLVPILLSVSSEDVRDRWAPLAEIGAISTEDSDDSESNGADPGTEELTEEASAIMRIAKDSDEVFAAFLNVIADLRNPRLFTMLALDQAPVGDESCEAMLRNLDLVEPSGASQVAESIESSSCQPKIGVCVEAAGRMIAQGGPSGIRLAETCVKVMPPDAIALDSSGLEAGIAAAAPWTDPERSRAHSLVVACCEHLGDPGQVLRAEYSTFLRTSWEDSSPPTDLLTKLAAEVRVDASEKNAKLNDSDVRALADSARRSTLPEDMRRYWLCFATSESDNLTHILDDEIEGMATSRSALDRLSLSQIGGVHSEPGRTLMLILNALSARGRRTLGNASDAVAVLMTRVDVDTTIDVVQEAVARQAPHDLAPMIRPEAANDTRMLRALATGIKSGSTEGARKFALQLVADLPIEDGRMQTIANAVVTRVRLGHKNDLLLACQHYGNLKRANSVAPLNGAMRQSAKRHPKLAPRVQKLTA